MSTRFVTFSEREFYHVYNRGTDKRIIYQSTSDYDRFLELLFLSNNDKAFNSREVKKVCENVYEYPRGNQLVALGAYCLMPNHFHLLVTPLVDGGLTKFMGKLMTGYSMYFNKKYERTGALFEGAFKAKHADSDEYLKYLFSYIHMNPVSLTNKNWKEEGINNQEEIFEIIREYRYSSLGDHLMIGRDSEALLNKEVFPEYFLNKKDVEKEIFSWLTYGENPS
jgi:putative transposase